MTVNYYLLLRTPGEGPEPGIYRGTWRQLTDICKPECKLPQNGYGYRKIDNTPRLLEDAEKHWRDQGHRREIPRFSL